MTTSNTERPHQINDRGFHLDNQGKYMRMRRGAAVLARSPFIMDHFYFGSGGTMTSANTTPWITHGTGTTGADVPMTILANDPGGAISGTTGSDTDAGQAIAGVSVSWKPSTHAIANPMIFETRFKCLAAGADPTLSPFYIGFADAVTYTNDLAYKMSATSTFTTSVPTEWVGFGYTSAATSGNAFTTGGNAIFAISTIAGVDTATRLNKGVGSGFTSGQLIKDSSYHVYRVEVDVSGNATFYLDDTYVGAVASAVTPTVALTPFIEFNSIASVSELVTGTIDYMFVCADLGY